MCQLLTDDKSTFACSSPQDSLSDHSSSVLHRFRSVLHRLRSWRPSFSLPPPAQDNRVVLYFTSLLIVRRTYDDCRAVRSILRDDLRVAVDERDVSTNAGFLAELRRLTGGHRGEVALPQVFVGGRCAGGAEEIRRLSESDELRRIVDGATPACAAGPECERCDGVRLVICGVCSGSHKEVRREGRLLCYENGLLRCPSWCGPSVAV